MILQVMSLDSILLVKQLLVDFRMGSRRLTQLSSQFRQGYRNSHPKIEAYDAGYQYNNAKPNTWTKSQKILRKRDKMSRKIRISPT